MLNKLKKTAKHTIIYSIGNLSTKLIGFILLLLYTQHLSISDYGVLGILEVTNQFLIAVFGFRMSTAMLRWCASAKNEDEEKSIIFTTLLSISIIVLIFNLLFMPFRNEFSSIFFNTTQYSDYFLILFLSVSFGILNKIPFELIRFREKPVFFVTIASIKLATILTLTIYFIVVLKMGVKGIILSQLIGHIVLIALAIPFLLKNINWKFKISFFSEMFQYGFPLIFSTISAMLLTVGDRYIIKLFHAYSH
ncbi:MAG: oligosaccharide flippase family protein, partial [Calditrichia bacterium]|nr:oligosaccharide flippase family protein [Calditrichia bacterium]